MFYLNTIEKDNINNTVWNTAIYVRISEEEKNKSISDSIENQKTILNEYATVHSLNVYDIYEDDNVRGGSFDRPEFKRMIQDIENGHVNCVLVKELSRFGREHIDADHFLERYFPERGVRFISVLQGLDSVADPARMNSIEVPMLNIFNEQYLKQVSNSTKASLMMKRKEGKFVGSRVPYGYIRDPKDKHHLIIDENVCHIVNEIFTSFLDYSGLNHIAEELNKRKVRSPTAYSKVQQGKEYKKSNWTHLTVKGILKQELYTGDMVQGKTYSYNCKVNKRLPLPREEWDIVPNTHEAIIDRTLYEKVQTLLDKRSKPQKIIKPKAIPSLFSGFIVCKECGKKMVRNTAYYKNELGEKVSYNRYICSTSKKHGSKVCTSHIIREDTIHDILLEVIKIYINNLIDATSIIEKSKKREIDCKIAELDKKVRLLDNSISKVSTRLIDLYDDYKESVISLNEYNEMKEHFLNQKKEYQKQHLTLTERISSLENNTEYISEEVQACINLKGIKKIDRHVLVTLVDQIVIDENKNVMIDFKFKDELQNYIS